MKYSLNLDRDLLAQSTKREENVTNNQLTDLYV
jgi:hypothetical protein